MIELVLPSGRFARIRPVETGDIIFAYHDNPMLMGVLLAHRLVTIDGNVLELDAWMRMPAEEFFPILGTIGPMIKKATEHSKGIA